MAPSAYKDTVNNNPWRKVITKRPTDTIYVLDDVWMLIVAKAATNSIQDLCSFKMSCTATRNAGEEDIVYQCASIPYTRQIRWSWDHQDRKAINFLERCMHKGHPDILFQATHGHVFAQYVLSMMLMLRNDDDEAKNKGIKTFHALEASGALTICKVGFREVIKRSWPTQRSVPILNGDNQFCVSNTCPSHGNMGLFTTVTAMEEGGT
ncbi:F-box plant-like protein [Arachis hypogaea]|nr:F-box plant-like protein [Arachis hypogaea]